MDEYITEFVNFAQLVKVDKETKIDVFIKGLNPLMQDHLNTSSPDTYEEALMVARLKDATIHMIGQIEKDDSKSKPKEPNLTMAMLSSENRNSAAPYEDRRFLVQLKDMMKRMEQWQNSN